MNATGAIQSKRTFDRRTFDRRTFDRRIQRLVGALLLAAGALLVLWAALHRSAVAEVHQAVGYIDGEQGLDGDGCGVATGTLACETIQYAVDNTAYDVLRVAEGTYTESVLIHRELTLQGGWDTGFAVWNPVSYETTIVGESGTGVYAVTVSTATTVLLDGLTVFQGDDGVHLRANAGARLTNLIVHGTDDEGIESNGAWLIVSNTVAFDLGDNGILVEAGRAEIYSSTVHDTRRRGIYLRGTGPDTISHTVVYSTANDGIRIRNAGSGSLINNRVYSSTADGIQIDDVTVVLVAGNTAYATGGDGLKLDGAGSATLRDNTVYDVGDEGLQIQNGDVVTVDANVVYRTWADGILAENARGVVLITDNAISHTITGTAHAIYVGPGVTATIDHNTVYSAAADGVNFQGTTGLIRYNEIHQSGDQGINVNADHTTVLGNTVYDTQNEGLRVRSGSQVLIRDNVIYNVLGAIKDGVRIEPNVTATIIANTIYNATDDGITFNGSVGTISKNYVHHNSASGIDVDAEAVTISANRVFSNGVTGIELERAGQFTVSNNLVGENVAGGVLVIGTLSSTGWLVNNTLVGHSSSPLGVGVNVLSNTVTLTSANNIIVSHTVGISVAAGAWVTTTYDNLWHNGANYGISDGTGSIHQDPLLVDAKSRDYHLLLGSPCIDKGWESLALEFPFDFEGHPRAGRIEIGADEVGLWVVKEAPAVASPGAPITYIITISNYYNVTLTQVVVTDAVPTGAQLIDKHNERGHSTGGHSTGGRSTGGRSTDGAVVFDNGLVWWTVDSIPPTSGTAQVSFVVTATETITNNRYRVVTSTQGVSSGMGPEVVTIVEWRIYLPIVIKNL